MPPGEEAEGEPGAAATFCAIAVAILEEEWCWRRGVLSEDGGGGWDEAEPQQRLRWRTATLPDSDRRSHDKCIHIYSADRSCAADRTACQAESGAKDRLQCCLDAPFASLGQQLELGDAPLMAGHGIVRQPHALAEPNPAVAPVIRSPLDLTVTKGVGRCCCNASAAWSAQAQRSALTSRLQQQARS